MRQAVELLDKWCEFSERYPQCDLHEFYLHQIEKRKSASSGTGVANDRALKTGLLLRIIGRLSSAYALYHRAAMSDMGLPSPDSFYYLNSVNYLGEVRKTELINHQFAETTTGMAAIAKLVDEGMIKERSDPSDARARLIKITDKGRRKLEECIVHARKANEMLFKNLDIDAIDLAISLLSQTEQEHSKLAILVKNRSFEDMYAKVMKDL